MFPEMPYFGVVAPEAVGFESHHSPHSTRHLLPCRKHFATLTGLVERPTPGSHDRVVA